MRVTTQDEESRHFEISVSSFSCYFAVRTYISALCFHAAPQRIIKVFKTKTSNATVLHVYSPSQIDEPILDSPYHPVPIPDVMPVA